MTAHAIARGNTSPFNRGAEQALAHAFAVTVIKIDPAILELVTEYFQPLTADNEGGIAQVTGLNPVAIGGYLLIILKDELITGLKVTLEIDVIGESADYSVSTAAGTSALRPAFIRLPSILAIAH